MKNILLVVLKIIHFMNPKQVLRSQMQERRVNNKVLIIHQGKGGICIQIMLKSTLIATKLFLKRDKRDKRNIILLLLLNCQKI